MTEKIFYNINAWCFGASSSGSTTAFASRVFPRANAMYTGLLFVAFACKQTNILSLQGLTLARSLTGTKFLKNLSQFFFAWDA